MMKPERLTSSVIGAAVTAVVVIFIFGIAVVGVGFGWWEL